MKIVIYGATDIASIIAAEFFEDNDIIVIDPDPEKLCQFSHLDLSVISGDAGNINILKQADIKNADVFIAASDLDEANIVGCIMTRYLSCAVTLCFVTKKECQNSLKIISENYRNTEEININFVIWPQELLTREIFSILTVPDAVDVEDFHQGKAKLLEYRIKENSPLLNKKLKDTDFNNETLVVGIARNDALFIPYGEDEFKINDKCIFMGTPEGLDLTAARFFTEEKFQIKNVAVIGGGTVGFELAKLLEKTKIKVKLVEKDYKRCEFLSEELNKTLILNADGTNSEFLNAEGIGQNDVVIAVTDSDEKNLLCSLLTKQLGAKRVITRVDRLSTVSLFENVGIDVAVSPKQAALNEVKNRIIDSKMGILATVERGMGKIQEIKVHPSFKDCALMNLKLPVRAVIAIIQRGTRIIIPKGQTLIRANDSLLVFTMADDAPKIREFFEHAL
ncbi:MAG: Trk system potassium transporter TrkA [Candidatus Gastranaerophilales bacterium]|nr:Trk system potassium transporter TrkA [Candidatus Gastranaerophilales bacterium]